MGSSFWSASAPPRRAEPQAAGTKRNPSPSRVTRGLLSTLGGRRGRRTGKHRQHAEGSGADAGLAKGGPGPGSSLGGRVIARPVEAPHSPMRRRPQASTLDIAGAATDGASPSIRQVPPMSTSLGRKRAL